jgi:hypothetical protein
MTKARILNYGSGRRMGPYQGANQGLQPCSALHVPTSPTSRLVGRLGPAYQRALRVGTKDKDEPRGQPVVHGQPLLPRGLQSLLPWQQGTTVLPAHPRERMGQNVLMIRPERPPPLTTKWLGEEPGMGCDSRTVPIDASTTAD